MVYSPEFFRQFPIFSDLTSNELAGVAEISISGVFLRERIFL